MNRFLIIFLTGAVAGCASAPETPPASEVPFAVAYLERASVAVPADGQKAKAPAPPPDLAAAGPVHGTTTADETRGLLEVSAERLEVLRRLASDDKALSGFLSKPVARKDLEALAWLRAPGVRAAREQLAAARTAYRQSADLRDLVALYRSFARETVTRVGPEQSRRATGSIAPYPNVDALSGELVARNVAIAFERLRRTIREVIADAERAHADAARLAATRRVVGADVELHRSLVAVMSARLKSGKSSQASLLAFRARLVSLRTELAILEQQETAVRARWNRLLSRTGRAVVNLDLSPSGPKPDAASEDPRQVMGTALTEQQELRIATLSAERAAVAVRLAETMTLPRMDLGTSRFERERAGEAGAQRGAVFPKPGRMIMPRSDFGVREAQVTEMRARHRAAVLARDAARDRTQSDVSQALFLLDAARRRWLIHRDEVVPLAERAFESTRGGYEGNRTGYIELLDSARRMLRARLRLVDTRKEFAHARAQLLHFAGVRTARKEGSK